MKIVLDIDNLEDVLGGLNNSLILLHRQLGAIQFACDRDAIFNEIAKNNNFKSDDELADFVQKRYLAARNLYNQLLEVGKSKCEEEKNEVTKKCDTCANYNLYFDKCNKFNREVDDRYCCSSWEPRENSKCEEEQT